MIIMGCQYIAIPFTCSTFLDFVVSYTLIGMTFGCQLTLPIVILNDYLGMYLWRSSGEILWRESLKSFSSELLFLRRAVWELPRGLLWDELHKNIEKKPEEPLKKTLTSSNLIEFNYFPKASTWINFAFKIHLFPTLFQSFQASKRHRWQKVCTFGLKSNRF